ncbi:MAG: redoxin domain-containing protein [Blastocatellia bacterium]
MKLPRIPRFLYPLTLFSLTTFCLLFTACESGPVGEKKASVESLAAPLSTATPAAAPSVDPRVTDLNRVQVGMEAPDFSLEDMDRNEYRLSSLRGKKNVILVFYRGYF